MSFNLKIDSIKTFDDVRAALQKVKEAFEASILERGDWDFYQITLNAAVTNFKYSHKLNFTPKDVIQISITGAGVVTWNYASFDRTFIYLSSTGPCVVRAFIGRHIEGVS